MIKNLLNRFVLTVGIFIFSSPICMAQWQEHEVRQLNGQEPTILLSSKFQIVSESWNKVATVPYIIYIPEKDRLLMLVSCDYPHRAFTLTSDDRGATWTNPQPTGVDAEGKPVAGGGVIIIADDIWSILTVNFEILTEL